MTGRTTLWGVVVALVAALVTSPVGAQDNGDETDGGAGAGDVPVSRFVDDMPARAGSPWYVGSAGDGYGDNNFTYTYVQGTSNSSGEAVENRIRARWDFPDVPAASECRLEVYVPYRRATAEVYYHVFHDGAAGDREYVGSTRLDQSEYRHWVLLATETLNGLVRVYVSNYEWRGLVPRSDERGFAHNRVAADAMRLTCGDVTPLAAPEPITVSAGDRSATVTWPEIDGADGYLVTWRATGGVDDAGAVAGGTSHTIEGLTNGVAYEVRVRALASGEGAATDGPFSIAVEVTPHFALALDAGGSTPTDDSGTDGPSTAGPSTGGPSTGGPSTGGPSTGGPSTGGPSTGGPSTGGSSTGGSSTGGPSTAESSGPTNGSLIRGDCYHNPGSAGNVPAPGNLRAVGGDGRIDVSWNAVPNTPSYVIKWAPRGDEPLDMCVPGPNIGSSETTSYTIPGLTNGQTYTVAVWAQSTHPTLDDSIPVATTATPSA